MVGLPFRNGSFDAVTAYHSLIHVPREQHQEAVDEFARVLADGGRLLCSEGPDEWSGTNPDWLDTGVEMQWHIAGVEATRDHLRKRRIYRRTRMEDRRLARRGRRRELDVLSRRGWRKNPGTAISLPYFLTSLLPYFPFELGLAVAHERRDALHEVVGVHHVAEAHRLHFEAGLAVGATGVHRAFRVLLCDRRAGGERLDQLSRARRARRRGRLR